MSLPTTSFACLLAAGLAIGCIGCIDVDDPEVARTSQEGIFTQGIFTQGIFTQGIFTQGIFTQGVSASGAGPFDGALNGAELAANMRNKSGVRLANVRLVGSQLRATANGVGIAGTKLQGATWLSNGLLFRIKSVRVRPQPNLMAGANSSNADAWEYEITWKPQGRLSRFTSHQPLCRPGADGDQRAILVAGSWQQSRRHTDDGNITIGCSSGTIHKCAYTWGYKPWKRARPAIIGSSRASRLSVALGPLHRACVYAASAALCESGRAHTEEGTVVNMTDRYGFNRSASQQDLDDAGIDASVSDFVDESWYDENGAVAVNYERYRKYFQEDYPTGSNVDIYEPDENDVLEYACRRPRSTGGDPTDWLVKIKSDRTLWRDLNPELPWDGTTILDEEGPMGPNDGGRGDEDGILP